MTAAKGVPTVNLTCALCDFVSPVMQSFESLFYLHHVEENGEIRHYVRPVPRDLGLPKTPAV